MVCCFFLHVAPNPIDVNGIEIIKQIHSNNVRITWKVSTYTGACRGGFPGVSGNPFWISLLQVKYQFVYQLYLTKTISIIGKNLTIQ